MLPPEFPAVELAAADPDPDAQLGAGHR
jgi:hypothetical protein